MFRYKYNAKRDAFAKKLTRWIKNEYFKEIFRCFFNFKFCFLEKFIQDYLIEFKNLKAENLTVVIVPEKNAMSGAIYTFFRLAHCTKNLFYNKKNEVLIMTRTYPTRETYVSQAHFNTDEEVFRFEQITKFKNVKNLTLHIPEYATRDFYKLISNKTKKYLSKIKDIHINILNQNINLMPDKDEFVDLYKITQNITQTVAHMRYCNQKIADKYNLKTLYFPISHDFSTSPDNDYNGRKNIIIYSPDCHPKKEFILNKLKNELPEFELIEIKNVRFEKFIRLASEAKFSISFGEGFDGYYVIPTIKGGVGLAVYNEEFFPASEYKGFDNIFSNYEDMKNNIVKVIKQLNSSEKVYQQAHKIAYDNFFKYAPGYMAFDKILSRFVTGDFDFYPQTDHKREALNTAEILSIASGSKCFTKKVIKGGSF